jgi:hypothetical protein
MPSVHKAGVRALEGWQAARAPGVAIPLCLTGGCLLCAVGGSLVVIIMNRRRRQNPVDKRRESQGNLTEPEHRVEGWQGALLVEDNDTADLMRSMTREEILFLRKQHFAKNLSISFSNKPLCIVKASGAYLFDASGRR